MRSSLQRSDSRRSAQQVIRRSGRWRGPLALHGLAPWLRVLAWVAVTAIAVGSPIRKLRADESDDILWASRPAGHTIWLAQLHSGGYAWAHLEGSAPKQGLKWVELNIAFRTEPHVYDELRQHFRAAGLATGVTAECASGFRVGIYPVPRLSWAGFLCGGRSGLIDELESALFPALETFELSWQRLLEITHAALQGAASAEQAKLELTLTRSPGRSLVEAPDKRSALVSDELIQALKGPWSVEPVLVQYTASARAAAPSRVGLSFPKNTRLFVNGTDVTGSPLFTLVDSPDGQLVTAWRNLPARWYRFDRGSGNVAHAWIYEPSSFWFPSQIWEDSPDIAIDYKRGAAFVARARFEPAKKDLKVCTIDKFCRRIEAADARGLAAFAYAECEAALAARQPANSGRNQRPVRLFVRIAQNTCELGFDRYCLPERRPGLDLLLQDLEGRSTAHILYSDLYSESVPEYPLCGGAYH